MSNIFSISAVTNAGIAAMQDALEYGYTMTFTAMKTGNGVYTSGEDVTGRTALKSLKNTYAIGSMEEDADGATVNAVFTNYDGVNILVNADYKINEIGLFCTVNDNEVLYALAAVPNDDGMEMPAYDVAAQNLTQFVQAWYIANSNHADIEVTGSGAFIPYTDIVNSLASTATNKPLAAAQGKALQDEIDALSVNTHVFTNKTVATTDFVADATYTDYGYKAVITCTGVTSSYVPTVNFDVEDAESGIFAPVALTGSGTVTIYASEVPSANITIPSIVCVKGA